MAATSRSWTVDEVEDIGAETFRTLAQIGHRDDEQAPFAFALHQIDELGREDDRYSQLRRFTYVLAALRLFDVGRGGSCREIERLSALGDDLLRANGVPPRTSQLSFLHRDLKAARAAAMAAGGDRLRAVVELRLGGFLAARSVKPEPASYRLQLAEQLAALGHLELGMAELEALSDAAIASADRRAALLLEARIRWLSGDRQRSLRLVEMPMEGATAQEQAAATWLRLCSEPEVGRRLTRLLAATRAGKPHHRPLYVLRAYLWVWASESVWPLRRRPSLAALARRRGMTFAPLGVAFRAALAVEAGYDVEIPLETRVVKLSEALLDARRATDLEAQLLLLLAVSRCLARAKARGLADVAAAEYRELSRRLSGGRSGDVLGLATDAGRQAHDEAS
jgi:hypothetical protein